MVPVLSLFLVDSILPVILFRVKNLEYMVRTQRRYKGEYPTYLPPRRWENMFIPLIPTSLNHFTSMRFILLFCRVGQKTNIVMDIKVKQRS